MKWKNVTTLVSYISVREKKVIEISHIDRRACVRSIWARPRQGKGAERRRVGGKQIKQEGGGEGPEIQYWVNPVTYLLIVIKVEIQLVL